MALRAGYYGLKTRDRSKLLDLIDSIPEGLSPENPIASKNEVLTSVDLLKDTTGWTGKNELPNNLVSGSANHVNYSVKDNKSVEIYTDEGGSTAQTTMLLVAVADNYKPKAGQKILSVSEEATAIQIVVAGYNGTTWVKNLANTNTHTPLNIDYDGYERVGVYLLVNANNEIDHKIAYPMIVDADAYAISPTYEPYHESVAEMFAKVINLALTITTDNYTGDIDDLDAGIRYCTNAAVHNPGNAWGYCITIKNPSNKIQLFIGQASTGIWYRRFASSAWQAWNMVTLTEVTANREDETKKATKKKVIKEEED